MKNFQKIITGLLLMLVLTAIGLALPKKALAASISEDGWKNATFTFVDRSLITATAEGQTVNFVDAGPFDTRFQYVSDDECKSTIELPGSFSTLNLGKFPDQVEPKYIHLRYNPSGTQCHDITATNSIPKAGFGAGTYFNWVDSGTIQSVDGKDTFTKNTTDGVFYRDSETHECVDRIFVSDDNAKAVYFELDPDGYGRDKFAQVKSLPSCAVYGVNEAVWIDGVDRAYGSESDLIRLSQVGTNIAGTQNAPKPPATGTPGSTSTDCGTLDTCLKSSEAPDSSACVANSNTTLEWLACPLMTSISKGTDLIYGYVEGQLHFNVDQQLRDCNSATDENCPVNRAWSIIKNIVAAMLVIIMLVMVISQAIGAGPFDAYIVKKILPRLVIAVVVMQFSWVLSKYMISLANDLAIGLKQIMLAPFGGGGNLDLPSIMNHLNPLYPAATNWPVMGVMLVLLFTFSTFILPAVLFIALSVGSALLVALATLVFRNILILMAVIFSPVALLLWVLPGQTFQGYWKKYSDNFIRLLLLFPLVMGMIYAGRIAAYLAGNFGNAGLVDYLVVLICYFGPLFFLPKTFKWGGSILGGVSQAVRDNKLLNQGKAYGNRFISGMAADRSAQKGAGYNDQDNFVRAKQMNAESRWMKFNPLRRAMTKDTGRLDRQGNPIRVGRRNIFALGGRYPAALAGGAPFLTRRQKEHMLKRSEAYKGEGDEGAKVRNKRLGEASRSGLIPAMAFVRDKSGKLMRKVFPKGHDISENAYWATLPKQLNNPDFRYAGQTAKDMATNPRFGIHANGRVELDPSNRAWRTRRALEKKHGLKGDYDAKNESPQDKAKLARLNTLQDLGVRNEAQQKEMEELSTLYQLRMGGARPYNKKWRDKMNKNIEILEKTRPDALEEGPLGNTPEQIRKGEAVYYVRIPDHPAMQEKAVSDDEVAQGLANTSFMDLPVIRGKYREQGLKYNPNPNADIGAGYYNKVDEINYAETDHVTPQREASLNESQEVEGVHTAKEAKKNFDFGLIGKDNLGGTPMLPADKRLDWYVTKIVDRRDQTAAQVLTAKTATESTKVPFDQGFAEGTLTPADLPRLLQHVQEHPHKRAVAAANVKAMYERRRKLGIPDTDARGPTSRDLLIAQDTNYYRQYYPDWTAEETRAIYDTSIDPAGAKGPEPVPPVDLSAFPDFQPPPPPPPPPPARRERPTRDRADTGGPAEPEYRRSTETSPFMAMPGEGERVRTQFPTTRTLTPGELRDYGPERLPTPSASVTIPAPSQTVIVPNTAATTVSATEDKAIKTLESSLQTVLKTATTVGRTNPEAQRQAFATIVQLKNQIERLKAPAATGAIPSIPTAQPPPATNSSATTSPSPQPAAPQVGFPAPQPTGYNALGQNEQPVVRNANSQTVVNQGPAPGTTVGPAAGAGNANAISTGSLRSEGVNTTPGVLRIDHNELYNTVYEAAKKGMRAGAADARKQGINTGDLKDMPITFRRPGNEPPAQTPGPNGPDNLPPGL